LTLNWLKDTVNVCKTCCAC